MIQILEYAEHGNWMVGWCSQFVAKITINLYRNGFVRLGRELCLIVVVVVVHILMYFCFSSSSPSRKESLTLPIGYVQSVCLSVPISVCGKGSEVEGGGVEHIIIIMEIFNLVS